MKKLLVLLIFLCPGVIFAQRPIRRPMPSPQISRQGQYQRTEKREELSRKLVERKNELRKEEQRRDIKTKEIKPRSKY